MRYLTSLLPLLSLTLLRPISAMNPEDVKGVIANVITPNPDLCKSLCQANSACFYSLYHLQCDECFLLDCGLSLSYSDAIGEYKPSFGGETRYYCNTSMAPDMPTDCKNVNATATVTSLAEATETAKGNGGALERVVSWGLLVGGFVGVLALV
jgi:hypothetical protein